MSARLKRNAVVVTMALLVCAAAALNWKYTGQQTEKTPAAQTGETTPENGTKILGEATLVSGGEGSEAGDEETVYTGSDYFASARLTRQQARDSAISLLQQAETDENAAEDVLNEASRTLQVLAGYTVAESQIESLVTAKGYADCVVFMGVDSCSVVVSDPDGLDEVDAARIKDIVVSETAYTPNQIKIMEAN